MGSKRAYLHPRLADKRWMIMEIELDNDRLVFEGELNVEKGPGPARNEPNGTFYYPDKLPLPEPGVPLPEPGSKIPVYASYIRDMDGPKAQLVRINFAADPSENAKQYGYYESDGPIESLIFISGAKGPGDFFLVPKQG